MKIIPAQKTSLFQRPSRWSRLLVVTSALLLGASGAFAQTYGVSTYAGAAFQAANTDTATGPATAARFSSPKGVAVDAAGNLYVADSVNGAIRKIAVTTGITTTVASGFVNPSGVAVDTAGVLYVADTGRHRIATIVVGGTSTTVTVIAGESGTTTGTSGLVDNATGTAARFFNPSGIVVNGAGTIAYVADTGNHIIRRIDLTTNAVTTIAGTVTGTTTLTGNPGVANGSPGTTASFTSPYALALSGALIFVADRNNHSIRQIDTSSSNAVTTFAGTSGTSGSTDSPALFRNPQGIAADAGGILFVADAGNSTIRRITSTGAVTTVAGVAGTLGVTDGLGTASRFQTPFGIAVHSSGVIYVADADSQNIRRLALATAPTIGTTLVSTPSGNAVTAGGNISLNATISGSPAPTVTWQVQPAAGGGFTALTIAAPYSVSTTGTTATLTITGATAALNGNQYRVVATNGVLPDPAPSAALTLTVNQPPTLANATTTGNFTIGVNGTFTFVANGSPAPDLSILSGNYPVNAVLTQVKTAGTTTGTVTWSPSTTEAASSPYTCVVKASNGLGTDATQSFTLTVLTGPSIATHPANQVISPGGTATFSVNATSNSGALTYQWQRQGVGTLGFFALTDNGHYTGSATSTLSVSSIGLSESGDQFRVVVTSGAGNPAQSNVASLTVTQSPQITSLNNAIFVEGQNNQFTVQATGSPAPTFSITSGSLPPNISLLPSTGVISGIPATGASATPQYVFTVTASNGVFPDSQQTFTLTVSPTAAIPTFTTQPVSVSASLGQAITYSVVVTGTPTPTIVWQRQAAGSFGFIDLTNNVTFSGVNTQTLVVTNPSSGMNGDIFRAVASSTSGIAYSNAATLTLVVGTTLSTFAGQPGLPGAIDDVGTAARFNTPASIATDASGSIYVADTTNHVIRKITSAGVVTTLAGLAGVSGSTDGTGTVARFNGPAGIAVSSLGTVYVADTFNHTIRVVSPQGAVTTLAGSAGLNGVTDAVGALARFNYPSGVAVDFSGTVYVADTLSHTIRRITPDGSVSLLAGSPGTRGAVNDFGSNARFASPNALAIDNSGNIYVADSFNHAIRRVTTSGQVTTFSGTLGTVGTTDSPPLYNQPSGIAVNSSGDVFVADTYSNTIRRIAASTGVVTTIAGFPGASGSVDGIGSAARMSQPYGIAVDTLGNIYVADTRNHTIRRSGTVSAPQIQTHPVSRVLPAGGSATFTVTATGTPPASIFQWQRQAAGVEGFVNLNNDSVYSGVTTATLTVAAITSEMNGDQFRVQVSNLISPDAVSNAAVLTVGVAPVFTSTNSATVRATNPLTFTVAATGTPTPTFTAIGVPAWATFNSVTGVFSGTPPDTAGSPFTITFTAANGLSVNQTFTLTVTPAVLPPVITGQPANVSIDQGQTATFSVTATGTAPFSYQWRRNGLVVPGATGPTLSIPGAQPANGGTYSVTVQNSVGSVVSNGASLVVNTAPVFVSQPRAQTALAGSTVVFAVEALGSTSFNYQWRKNGISIAGAIGSTFTLTTVTASDVGSYDVIVSNALGQIISSLAQLTVVTAPVAPAITVQPANRTALLGGSTTLTVAASGAPSPGYQWRRNGANIANANNPSFVIPSVQASDAASYDVVVTNSVGSTTSNGAILRVIARSYAGYYFGTFSNSLGSYAILVRDDNTGIFLGYLPGSVAPVTNLNISVNDSGQFVFAQNAIAAATAASAAADEPVRAAALAPVTVSGTIGTDGTISGTIQGGASASLSGSRASDTGASQSVSGFYQMGASTGAATTMVIAGPGTQAFFVTQSGANTDGGLGSVNANGQINIAGNRSAITATINQSTRVITGTSSGAIAATLNGASEAALATQRLVNISSRARVGTGDSVAIAGFVISGEESKPVLIRAVGPTIGAAPFNVGGSLAAPRLELFRGSTSLAVNTGIATNRAPIDAAGLQAGAFALGTSGADAAMFITLAPGNYTAVVSSTTNTAGVALVEVYDLSTPAAGQKLLNIATRAAAGTGDNTLIAGFVVPPGPSKRVIVRAVGPGLTPFGVAGVLAQPTLILLNGAATVAQNTNWSTSADAAAITAASAQVGAFGLANNDSALIATLAPGNYTAQVLGAGGSTGVALIEVYELP